MIISSPPPSEDSPAECLHAAAVSGDIERMREAIERGASIEDRDNDGATPLLNAAANNASAALWLIDQGANIHAIDNACATALIWAATNNQPESSQVCEALIARGADLEAVDEDENSALRSALWAGPERVSLLLDAGADWRRIKTAGANLLHDAVFAIGSFTNVKKQINVIRNLVAKGLDINALDRRQNNPLDQLVDLSHDTVKTALIELIEMGARGGRYCSNHKKTALRAFGSHSLGEKPLTKPCLKSCVVFDHLPWLERAIAADPACQNDLRPLERAIEEARTEGFEDAAMKARAWLSATLAKEVIQGAMAQRSASPVLQLAG